MLVYQSATGFRILGSDAGSDDASWLSRININGWYPQLWFLIELKHTYWYGLSQALVYSLGLCPAPCGNPISGPLSFNFSDPNWWECCRWNTFYQGDLIEGPCAIHQATASPLGTDDNYLNSVSFCRRDGTFKVTGLTGGTYVVEIAHPTFVFPPFRVDITQKGSSLL